MWRKHAHTLPTLTKLCSMKVKFRWTDIEIYAFIDMNILVGHDVLLSYPNFG